SHPSPPPSPRSSPPPSPRPSPTPSPRPSPPRFPRPSPPPSPRPSPPSSPSPSPPPFPRPSPPPSPRRSPPPSPRPSPPPSVRPSPPLLNVRTIKGILSTAMDIVDGVEQLVVSNDGGELVPVDMGTFQALAPSDYTDYKPGDFISMKCNMTSSGVCYPTSYRTYSCSAYGLCSWSSGGSAFGDYMDDEQGVMPIDFTQPNPIANYKERLLVMVLDFSTCGYPAAAGLNESSTRAVFLEFDRNARVCSNGFFGLDLYALRVLVMRPNCSASITTSCAWWTMANYANLEAKSILGDDDVFNNFTHYAYILPPELETKCLWARGGTSLLPGKQFWLQTTMLGSVNRWEVFLHMNLHNYGQWIPKLQRSNQRGPGIWLHGSQDSNYRQNPHL
ncbi:hypothetical protein Vretimale_65, partial [Volvox reticuliferus]